MTIALARDVEDFLQDQVRSGACADASELVNDVLRSVRQQQPKPFEVAPELEAWLLEAADKPSTTLVKKRLRRHPGTSADPHEIFCFMNVRKSDDFIADIERQFEKWSV